MSIVFSYANAEEKMESWQVDETVRHLLAEHRMTMVEMSGLIGKQESFVRKGLQRKSISLPLLYVLSVHLKTNLFEPLLLLLPETLQATRREAALQAQIESLKSELAQMTKERDIYKEVAGRK